MYLAVVNVKPNEDYKLMLTFENGEKRIYDMIEYLNFGIFSELKDRGRFNTVHVAFDSIEWSNGADLDPEILYEKSIPAKDLVL